MYSFPTEIYCRKLKCQQFDLAELYRMFHCCEMDFEFLKKLCCCVGGRVKQKFGFIINKLIKVELPPLWV